MGPFLFWIQCSFAACGELEDSKLRRTKVLGFSLYHLAVYY